MLPLEFSYIQIFFWGGGEFGIFLGGGIPCHKLNPFSPDLNFQWNDFKTESIFQPSKIMKKALLRVFYCDDIGRNFAFRNIWTFSFLCTESR
jgi:hypothetical protein